MLAMPWGLATPMGHPLHMSSDRSCIRYCARTGMDQHKTKAQAEHTQHVHAATIWVCTTLLDVGLADRMMEVLA